MIRITFSLLLLATGIHASSADCIPDWSEAAPIVHREKLATVEALSRLSVDKLPGSIVKTTLCEEEGAFVYRLVVRDAQGRLTNRTVDARTPFAR